MKIHINSRTSEGDTLLKKYHQIKESEYFVGHTEFKESKLFVLITTIHIRVTMTIVNITPHLSLIQDINHSTDNPMLKNFMINESKKLLQQYALFGRITLNEIKKHLSVRFE